MTDSAIYFRQQAERCFRLAWSCADERTTASLRLMAQDFLEKAQQLEGGENDNLITVRPIKS